MLANVKTRGGWGEVQLGALLEQVLTPDQFARNVKTRDESGEHVDFAIKLPGDENGAPVWLPIDAKFPTEDYQRLLAAQEKGDADLDRERDEEFGNAVEEIAPRIFARNTLIRRARPISRLCFCRRKDCMPKRFAASVWCEQVQRDCRVFFRRADHAGGVTQQFANGFSDPRHSEDGPVKCGICSRE